MGVMTDHDSGDSPQRVIAVSLGKIAACRGQRGGPTLRRSLLISTILHKARTTMMMENFQVMMEARRAAQMEEEEAAEVPETVEEAECEDDMEAASPAAPRVWPAPGHYDQPDYDTNTDKENSPPTYIALQPVSNTTQSDNSLQEKDTNIESDISCAKCSKRRLADCYESDIENNNSSECKRLKLDSDNAQSDNESKNVQTDSSCNSQISSLVHRFNSGLSGFLGGHVTACKPEENSTEQILPQNVSSCATQVTKELGALSRTCIALSV